MSAIKLVFDPEFLLSCRRISSKNVTYPYLLVYINTLTSTSFSDKQFLLTYTDPDDKATSLTIDSHATLSAALAIHNQPTLVIKVSLIKEDLINAASSWEMVSSVPSPLSSDSSSVPLTTPVSTTNADTDSSFAPLNTPVSSVNADAPFNAPVTSVNDQTINKQKYEIGECVEAKGRIRNTGLSTNWYENVWIRGYNKQDNTYHVVYQTERRYDENLPEQAIRKQEKFVVKQKYEVGELVEARWRHTSFPHDLTETWYKNVLINAYNQPEHTYQVIYEFDRTFDEHLPEAAIRKASVQDAVPVAATNATECKNDEGKGTCEISCIKLVPKYEIGKRIIIKIPLYNNQLQKASINAFCSSTGSYTVQVQEQTTYTILDTIKEVDILGYLIEPLAHDKKLSKNVISALTSIFQKYSSSEKYGSITGLTYFMTVEDFTKFYYACATSAPVKTRICQMFYKYCRSFEGVNDGDPVLLCEDFLEFYTYAVVDLNEVNAVWDDLFAHGYNAGLKHREIQYKISEHAYARLDTKNLQLRTPMIIVNEFGADDSIKFEVKMDINSINSWVVEKKYIQKMRCHRQCRHCHEDFDKSSDSPYFTCVCRCDGIARYI